MPGFRFLPVVLLLMGPIAAGAQAQTATGEVVVLEPLTLIGTGLPTDLMGNPASVTLIEGEVLTRQAPVTIAGLLRDVPGLQISEEGIERISLRGEQSRRIAILIDGQALTDHGNYGQPIPVDPTMIERIEVVRGSSSVVSGNRAIGGVVNIITKKGAARPFELTTSTGWISATRGWRGSISAAGTLELGAGVLDYRLGFGRMEQGDRRLPEGVAANTAVSDRTLSFHAGYRLGDHYFGLRGQQTDLSAGVFVVKPPGVSDWTVDLPQRDLRKVAVFYEGTDLTPWLDWLSFDLYRQQVTREFVNDITQAPAPGLSVRVQSRSDDAQLTFGASLTAEMHLHEGTRTVVGLQYEEDALTADKLTTTTRSLAPLPAIRAGRDEARVRTLSLFAEHEVELSPTLTGTIGARWYKVRASHDASWLNGAPQAVQGATRSTLTLGALGLVWARDESLSLRANVSQGYTYPTLGQLYLTTTGGSNTILPNPDLRPERATTWELGARLSRGALDLDATLFHTDSRDYITYLVDGSGFSQYENVSSARTWGLEVQAEYASGVWELTPYVTAALMRRELRFANGLRTTDSGTPRLSGRLGLRRSWALGGAELEADLFLRGESAARLVDASGGLDNGKEAAGWSTLNLATNLQWDNGLTLVAEFTNLANRSYHPFEQAPGARRGLSLFLTKSF